MTSLDWVASLTKTAISIEKIPFPSSYSRTKDTAGAALPATLPVTLLATLPATLLAKSLAKSLDRCAPGVERVIGARLFAEGAAAVDTGVLNPPKAMAAGFSRPTGAVGPGVGGVKTISWRACDAEAPSVTAAPAAADAPLSRIGSTISNDACRKLTPRICA